MKPTKKDISDLFKIEELEPRLELSDWDGSCNGKDNEFNQQCNNTNCENNHTCGVDEPDETPAEEITENNNG